MPETMVAPPQTVILPPGYEDAQPTADIYDRKTAAPPHDYPLTDSGNAERFAFRYGGEFLWTKATGWLIYRAGVWKRDLTNEVGEAMLATIRLIHLEARLIDGWDNLTDEQKAKREEMFWRFGFKCESNAKIKAAVESAERHAGFAKDYLIFDQQPHLFNLSNGTFDLNTNSFRAHDPNHLLTKISPIKYDPAAQCPQWERFLLEVMGGKQYMQEYLARAGGYTLSADTGGQCLFVPWGQGGTGKSTFLNVMQGVLGDYCRTADPEMFMKKRGDGGQPFEMAGKEGVRALFAIETEEGKELAAAKIKRMTGQDQIVACYKFKDQYSFSPQWKIWLATNDRPALRASDDAAFERVKLIPFTVKFRGGAAEIKNLAAKLLAEEASGILNWFLLGYRLYKAKSLMHPPDVDAAVREWREAEDFIGRFLEDRVEPTDMQEEFVTKAKLFEWFRMWSDDTKEGRGMTDKRFSEEMRKKGYEDKPVKQGGKAARVWMKLKLKSALAGYTPSFDPKDVM